MLMDIKSTASYPACSLSNFHPYVFVVDGVVCRSMEGFLQSLKFMSARTQASVCQMVGSEAKSYGRKLKWYDRQTLYWLGNPINRHGKAYQDLLDKAYRSLAESNPDFVQALIDTNGAKLTHRIGSDNPNRTILTTSEFVSRLNQLRDKEIW